MARICLCNLLALAIVLLLTVGTSPSLAFGHAYSNEYHGAGRRIKMSDIKTLTFYSDKQTAFRRTEPLPQLTCKGKPCRLFTPDVLACQSLGDGQWKCEADLPASMRMGRVEVSCEGYDAPSDPYVLKDSCALTYQLLPAPNVFTSEDDSLRRPRSRKSSGWTFQDLLDKVFPVLFLASLGWILWGFITAVLGNRPPAGTAGGGSPGGRGSWLWGGGGGGPGGGWWPGGGGGPGSGGPPPPYTKQEQYPSTSHHSTSTSSWRPGFWTGLATGAAALMMANRNRGAAEDRRYRNYDPYAGSGGLGAGWAGGGGGGYGYGHDSGAGSSREASSSSFRTSAGYGGTRNR